MGLSTLKTIESVICFSLGLLIHYFMDSGTFPSMFEITYVTSVYKSGDRTNVKNYRPISSL